MSLLDLVNKPLVVAIGVPFVGGMVSGLTTGPAIKGWYRTIRKPAWTPPNWLFGPMWTYLYISMGYASYLVYTNTTSTADAREMALTLYASQLLLNFAWTPLFFGMRQFGAASIDILALLGLIIATGVKFYEIDPVAGYLMVPYAGWVSLASSLSCWIWWHNPAGGKTKGQ
ncbi:hypothetical protein HK105_202195 [Polyrhizophydium stewartii]|uniref:TspO/MBR-related protein n=1 Tax=Polyrhizophydium stewartii TaxID=2732419 RepID=A0ABR4NFF1_9FUNG